MDVESDPKVLLTNTIYPEGPRKLDSRKPKYRVKGKTSPELVLKHVTATAVSTSVVCDMGPADARFAPGGKYAGIPFSEGSDGVMGCRVFGSRLKRRQIVNRTLTMRQVSCFSGLSGCK